MWNLKEKLDEAGEALDTANGVYDVTVNVYDETERTRKNLSNMIERRTSGVHQQEKDLARKYENMMVRCVKNTIIFSLIVIVFTIGICVFL